MGTQNSPSEREKTDESLAHERTKTDIALAEKHAVEHKADVVIDRARDEADAILATARAKADEKTGHCGDPSEIRGERAREDAELEAKRQRADDVLRQERAVSARILARLLPLERDKTDQHLSVERARSDTAIANRDDFLGMVSHDLRDLLAGITLNTSLIARDCGDGAEASTSCAAAGRIARSAARMNRLIGDLVDVAAIDAGKLSIHIEKVNACELVVECIDTWQPHARAKGLTLQRRNPSAVSADMDRERILQVLGNLITNAVKFSAPDELILVETRKVDGELQFAVTNRGEGIPSDKLTAVFERFWQVGKNDRRGLGLGLFISRCLVEAHGGRIWAESEPGTGCTFVFTIPLAA